MIYVLLRVAVFTAALVPATAWAQLPPGYWNDYDTSNAHYHRHRVNHELSRQRAPSSAAHGSWTNRTGANDPMDYEGRGMTGQGLSSYQSNGYRGSHQNYYYGYWDGGFTPGTYGFSMYPHFDRPGFTYWQY